MKIFLKNYIYAEAQIQETLVLHRLRVKAFCAERRVHAMGKLICPSLKEDQCE